MPRSYKAITAKVSASLAKLRADQPDTTRAISGLAQAGRRDGALGA